MSERSKMPEVPVVVEVAPLIKTEAAHMLAETVSFMDRYPNVNDGRWLDMRTARRDRAVPMEYDAGTYQCLNFARAVMGFRPSSYHRELTDAHQAQAKTLLGWLGHHPWGELVIQDVRMMKTMPVSFTTDYLHWRMNPPEERLLPDHKLPSDNDRPGELAVVAHSVFSGEAAHDRTGRVFHRALLFNGLGGNETIFPPAVAGIYELRHAGSGDE